MGPPVKLLPKNSLMAGPKWGQRAQCARAVIESGIWVLSGQITEGTVRKMAAKGLLALVRVALARWRASEVVLCGV